MKHFLVALVALFLSLTSCDDKYKDFPDGIYAELNTTKGTAIVQLKHEQTPLTVANFIALSEGTHTEVDSVYTGKKFYDNLTFHRVIKDFMIQGGDPKGNGTGNPGYRFADEIVDSLQHSKKGILSMANSGPETNGSQFFITLKATPWLNGKHTVFGEVVQGIEVIDSIGAVKTIKPGDKPEQEVKLNSVTIYRKGKIAEAFDAPKVFERETGKIAKQKVAKEAKAKALAKTTKVKLDKALKDAETKKSGLKVAFEQKGTGQKLTSKDKVGVFYAGYLTDGTLFDTNILEIAKSTGTFDQRRMNGGGYNPMPVPYSDKAPMIPGFKEGILSMEKIGDKAVFYIPSELGYGNRGGGPIPPNSDLIFKVEFKEIVK